MLIDRETRRAWRFDWADVESSRVGGDLGRAIARAATEGYEVSAPADADGTSFIGDVGRGRHAAILRYRDASAPDAIEHDVEIHDRRLSLERLCALLPTLDGGPAARPPPGSQITTIVLVAEGGQRCTLRWRALDASWVPAGSE